MSAADNPRQTVILVHGTFAAPKKGDLQWWQPGSEFCQQLDNRLVALGSRARTWTNLKLERMPVYSWSGKNSWADRYMAAQSLAKYFEKLYEDGWFFHVIAHSHGGNVLLQALQLSLAPFNYRIESHSYGNLVCLGTPFIPPVGHRPDDKPRLFLEVGGSLIVIVAVLICFWRYIGPAIPQLGWLWIPLALLFPFCLLILTIVLYFNDANIGPGRPEWKRLLVMSSKCDEIFQLLSQALSQSNPFVKRERKASGRATEEVPQESNWIHTVGQIISGSDRIRYPREDIAAPHQFFGMPNGFIVLSAAGALVLGIVSHALVPTGPAGKIAQYVTLGGILGLFASIMLLRGSLTALIALPARAVYAALLFAKALSGKVSDWCFRRYAWGAFRQWALGTSTFPLKVESTLFTPDFLAKDFYHVEEIPHHAEQAALQTREHDLGGLLAAVTENLMEPVVTDELLHLFETSPSSVHAVYYKHPECLDVIARWVARRDEQIDEEYSVIQDKLLAEMERRELEEKEKTTATGNGPVGNPVNSVQ